MKEIIKILKNFTVPIIFCIGLLIVQANIDLRLPDYTANIINIGIQENGIVYAYPEVISKDIYETIRLINDQEIVKNSYELKSKEDFEDKELEEMLQKYPLLETESLYFVKELTKEEKEELEKSMALDFMFVEMLKHNGESLKDTYPIPEGISVYEAFKKMPQNEQAKIVENYHNAMSAYDFSMINQMATEYVKEEYKTIGIELNDIQTSYIIKNGLIMLLLSLSMMLVAIGVGFLASRIATKFSYLLRNKVVSKIMSFSSKEFDQFSVASLITRSTNDIQQIQMLFVMSLRILIYAPILGFGALFKVIGNSMNWVLGLGIGLIFIIILFLFVFAMPKFRRIQKLVDRLNLVTRERLTGEPVIRAFGTSAHEEERFDKANKQLANVTQFCDRTMGIMMPTILFIMNGIAILIIWVGSKQIDLGTLQVGTLMAFITYSIQVIMSFLMISMMSIMLPRAWVSVKRIAEILNTKNSIQELENPIPFKDIKGVIEFKNVSFKYPDAEEEVLKNITFKTKPGTTTAFIGATGSGKSTLINLIPRFFDPTEGEIIVDGINIKEASIKSLRDKIGYVPQKGILFSGTIESNVLFGVDKKDENKMKKACEVAQATEFIKNLPKEYHYEISQGGTNVSGGQRQRLSIARAIAKNPEFYIFDDSFSALDFKTDANLRKALREFTQEATIFIVAQRISSIMHADQIIVLDDGKIVGKGTHQELLKSCKIYKEIALSQLKESELNG